MSTRGELQAETLSREGRLAGCSYLSGNGEEAGWLSIRLSCGESWGEKAGKSDSTNQERDLQQISDVFIRMEEVQHCSFSTRFQASGSTGIQKSYLDQDARPLGRRKGNFVHEVGDVPVDRRGCEAKNNHRGWQSGVSERPAPLLYL